jgi:hypothetical protein
LRHEISPVYQVFLSDKWNLSIPLNLQGCAKDPPPQRNLHITIPELSPGKSNLWMESPQVPCRVCGCGILQMKLQRIDSGGEFHFWLGSMIKQPLGPDDPTLGQKQEREIARRFEAGKFSNPTNRLDPDSTASSHANPEGIETDSLAIG